MIQTANGWKNMGSKTSKFSSDELREYSVCNFDLCSFILRLVSSSHFAVICNTNNS